MFNRPYEIVNIRLTGRWLVLGNKAFPHSSNFKARDNWKTWDAIAMQICRAVEVAEDASDKAELVNAARAVDTWVRAKGILWCREGANPHDRKDRRILSFLRTPYVYDK